MFYSEKQGGEEGRREKHGGKGSGKEEEKMIQGTTPALTLTLPEGGGLDLTGAERVFVTVKQGARTVTKQGEELELGPRRVTFRLTQEESLGFTEGLAEVQLNWLTADALDGRLSRCATKVGKLAIGKQLLTEVV